MATVSEFDGEVTIRRTRFANEETGWAVVDGTDASGEQLVMVGPLTHLEERERVHVIGSWVEDRRYGMQVKVSEARPLPPADEETLTIYLRRITNVGSRRAARLIAHFGAEGVLEAIDADPPGAFATVGLRADQASAAAASWDALRVSRQLHMLLAPHGLAYLVARLQQEYGDGAHRIVTEQPYRLTSVFGVGFSVADKIACGAGSGEHADERMRAAVLHVLGEAERDGSTCLPQDALLGSARELLREPVGDAVLEAMADDGQVVRAGTWIYRTAMAELEAELADRVRALVIAEPGSKLSDPFDGDETPSEADGLTDEQAAGVRAALTIRLSVITGGPGTGKTASIKAVATLALKQQAKVMLVAPTGRAAIRMTESSGVDARTVHSALKWIPGEGPQHDAEDPLPCDLLIVDESSMANLELMVTLLRAVGPQTHVVLVGDADQLAPVGAGKPFADLVASELVPTARLTHIFRQAAGSMIVQGAHAIRRGELPSFHAEEGMQRDLFLIERPDPLAAREEIVALVSERLPKFYGVDPVSEIQVFAPVYRGELGIDALNTALRGVLNPGGKPLRGGRLRLGDKLMMTGRNLHELGLMNGTVLRLIDEVSGGDDDDAALVLTADEGAVFRLPPEESERLRPAYACSVHRGQGIELPVAVIVAHAAGGAFFLRREMLYTAVTRAKLATVIVGTRDVIARAARTPDTGRRHSRLGERLLELS